MAKETTKKTVKKAAKKAVKKVAKKAVAAAPTPAPAPKKVAVKKIAAKKAVAKKVTKKVAKKAVAPKTTTIVAKIDVGFGNALYVRGSAAGLTWEAGVLMECSASGDEWSWTSTSVTDSVEFKLLINDETWALGENGVVAAGEQVIVEPSF
jgi:hypothetical protein